MDKNEMADTVFTFAAKLLDDAYAKADEVVNEVFAKADNLLNDIEKQTRARLDEQEQPKAADESVVDRQQKIKFVADYYDAKGESHTWRGWDLGTAPSIYDSLIDDVYEQAKNGTL